MPSSRHARRMRTAISPRLATRTFLNMDSTLFPRSQPQPGTGECSYGLHCLNGLPGIRRRSSESWIPDIDPIGIKRGEIPVHQLNICINSHHQVLELNQIVRFRKVDAVSNEHGFQVFLNALLTLVADDVMHGAATAARERQGADVVILCFFDPLFSEINGHTSLCLCS